MLNEDVNMAMPKREPTTVVRIPVVLNNIVLRIRAIHKVGKFDINGIIDNVLTKIEKTNSNVQSSS
jgi:hypothetical protein